MFNSTVIKSKNTKYAVVRKMLILHHSVVIIELIIWVIGMMTCVVQWCWKIWWRGWMCRLTSNSRWNETQKWVTAII